MRSRGSIPGEDKRFFVLLHVVQTGSGGHSASYTMDTGDSFHRGKADQSPPYSAEIKKGVAIPLLPHTYVLMACCLMF
jgi:hypothetical protein